jgi:hypothetical protein
MQCRNDCDSSFCNQCNKAHARLKQFKNHKIIEIVYTLKNIEIRQMLEEVWVAKKIHQRGNSKFVRTTEFSRNRCFCANNNTFHKE